MRDLYAVLGVERSATAEQVKAAYRQKVRVVHPDVAGQAGEAQMRELAQAYHVLGNPERRAEYDRTGLFDQLRELAADTSDRAVDLGAELANSFVDKTIPKSWGSFGAALRSGFQGFSTVGAQALRQKLRRS